MKRLFAIALIGAALWACNDDDDSPTSSAPAPVPIVQSDSTFGVTATYDLVYAEGLSHTTVNSPDYDIIPLKLDIYTPDDGSANRPLYMFIHGGGFVGGTKLQDDIVDFANYYTSRGWVFASIDYRLRNDVGSIPPDWLQFANNLPSDSVGQFRAIYPAQRDAKAALRWLMANAANYGINRNFVTVGGGSAGGITSITLGASEPEDFTGEISGDLDPTLSTTNQDQSFTVKTVIDFWGSAVAMEGLEQVYGLQRFDSGDPPIVIIHGTEDEIVPFNEATKLKALCENFNIPYAYYPLQGVGHGEWGATFGGKSLSKLVFDTLVATQNLRVE